MQGIGHGMMGAMILTACALIPAAGVANTANVGELKFRVLLDEREIGYHRFRIADRGDAQVIQSDADFDVRVLFLPVYSYLHENEEIWRDGCLARITSRTDANGDRYTVSGERRGEVFEIGTREETRRLEHDCVMSFAYWNRAFLTQRRLLNAQTGELVEVRVERLGERPLRLEERTVDAEGFRVLSPNNGIDITVWYAAADGRWLTLESLLEGGKVIRYLPGDAGSFALADNRTPARGAARR